MRILFFTKYAPLGASSRYRAYQYIPILREYGIQCDVSPLFDDHYLISLYSKKKYSWFNYCKRLMIRLFNLIWVHKYDLLVIEKELVPFFPPLFEYILKIFKIKYILDYDDAIFHRYDLNTNSVVQILLRKKIKKIMSWSDMVITGNQYLTQYARKYAKNVSEIPTVVDFHRYCDSNNHHDKEFVIGWIGTPVTSYYLMNVFPVLEKFTHQFEARIKLIGFDKDLLPELNSTPIEIIEWSEETEVEEIYTFSVGIMPLDNDPWSYGKCGLKLIQYMGCGKPVIASPVGVNTTIVENSVNGFLAETPEEWFDFLKILYTDKEIRKRMSRTNREKILKNYSLQVTGNDYYNLVTSLIA
jgi:glycosyltransferase involved in cell wall biosynthesis